MNIKHVSVLFAVYPAAFFLLIFISSNAFAFPYKGVEIKIKGAVDEIYDDNITFANDDELKDYITSLNVWLGVEYLRERRTLELIGRVTRQLNAKYSEFENSSENLALKFTNEFSRFDRVKLTSVYSHTKVPASFEEEFGRIRGRRESWRNSSDFRYTRDLGEHLAVTGGYTYGFNKYSEEEQDSFLNKLGLELDYKYSVATAFLLSYSYLIRNYEESGNFSSHLFTIGARKYLTKRLYFDGRTGIEFIESSNRKSTKNFTEVSLTDEFDENTSARVTFKIRDRTVPETDDIFSNWRITGLFKRRLSEKIRASLSGFYGQGEFVSTNVTDKLTGADADLEYEFNDYLTGNFSYTFSDLNSTGENRGYTRNIVTVGLAAEF